MPELQTSQLEDYKFFVITGGWSCPEIVHSKILGCAKRKQVVGKVSGFRASEMLESYSNMDDYSHEAHEKTRKFNFEHLTFSVWSAHKIPEIDNRITNDNFRSYGFSGKHPKKIR